MPDIVNKLQVMSGSMSFSAATISTSGFQQDPLAGSTLIMYLVSPIGTMGVTSVRSATTTAHLGGAVNWGLVTSVQSTNLTLQIFAAYNIPTNVTKGITINYGVSTNYWATVFEEVRGLTTFTSIVEGNTRDKISRRISRGVGNFWYTVSTAPAEYPCEYWVNIYGYKNPQNGSPNLSNQIPYTYFGSSPLEFNGAGNTSWSGTGSPVLPSLNAGIIVASTIYDKISYTQLATTRNSRNNLAGIASGIVTDSAGTASDWLAVSLSFYATPKRQPTSSWI